MKPPSTRRASELLEIDRDLLVRMLELADRELGALADDPDYAPDRSDAPDPDEVRVRAQCLVFHAASPTVSEIFVASRRADLSRRERRWIRAQEASWLSVWEVSDVTETGVMLEDLLTAERRQSQPTGAIRDVVARDAILARVVDAEGIAIVAGLHPVRLPPPLTDAVLEAVREIVGTSGKVSPERLRQIEAHYVLLTTWNAVVKRAVEINGMNVGPSLSNADGDAALVTTDHFEVDPRDRATVGARLSALTTVRAAPDGTDHVLVFVRPDPPGAPIIVARGLLDARRLRVESNSVERADARRREIEDACGVLVRHRIRAHTDPWRVVDEHPVSPAELERKRELYLEMLDKAHDGLGGKTPREASATKDLRPAVERLLRSIESFEARLGPGRGVDVKVLRRELGLD